MGYIEQFDAAVKLKRRLAPVPSRKALPRAEALQRLDLIINDQRAAVSRASDDLFAAAGTDFVKFKLAFAELARAERRLAAAKRRRRGAP
ncbi:MAG: hypothetical protein WCC90_17600 [Methylocella sp.]